VIYDRRKRIISILQRDGVVKVANLMEIFQVSIETIRRDLEALEKLGVLTRVYGGAIAVKKRGIEPHIELRKEEHYDEKRGIGERAVDFVEDGDVIVIDIGTTTMAFAHALVGKKKNLTVLTNSIPVAMALSEDDNIKTILLGGVIRKSEQSVNGNICDQNLGLFHTDKAFLGVGGLTKREGLTDFNMEEASFRRIAVQRTQKVIALADHSKYGVVGLNHICDMDEIDILITDRSMDKNAINEIQNVGVEVYLG